MEIENAVNQAKKELANRFDFKNSKWEIVLEKTEIKLTADNEFKVSTLNEIVIGKLAKRGISLKSVEQCEPDISPLGHARQSIKIKQGIEATIAKQITGFIRDGKFKVTTQIQGDEVRVNSKSREQKLLPLKKSTPGKSEKNICAKIYNLFSSKKTYREAPGPGPEQAG